MPTRANKSGQVLQASVTNASGGTTTGGTVDLTRSFGMLVTAKVTNGSTGPSAGCAFVMEVSHDGSTWKEFSRQVGGEDANGVYEFVVELPGTVMYGRSKFSGNFGQGVTIEAFGHEFVSVG